MSSSAQVALLGHQTATTNAYLKKHFAVSAVPPKNTAIRSTNFLSKLRSRVAPSEVVSVEGLNKSPGSTITVLFFKKESQLKLLAGPLEVQGVLLFFVDKYGAIRRQGTRVVLSRCPPGLDLGRISEALVSWGTVIKAAPASEMGFILGDRWEVTIVLAAGKTLPPKLPLGGKLVVCRLVGACFSCGKTGHTAAKCHPSPPPSPVAAITAGMAALTVGPSGSSSRSSSKNRNFRRREARRMKKAREEGMDVDARSF
ncbi:hypothetical protein H4R33_006994 [Dimargaris cristalligena]|nr:hypothetical protein H4R33_006994 [Dimargaris cristalligena]